MKANMNKKYETLRVYIQSMISHEFFARIFWNKCVHKRKNELRSECRGCIKKLLAETVAYVCR